MSTVIVDLGCSNMASISFALNRLGVQAQITSSSDVIQAADRIILPGVGASDYAMDRIRSLSLEEVLRKCTQPILGICLGMHLLFSKSEEGSSDCLGMLPGNVQKLPRKENETWPHMGWNKLSIQPSNSRLLVGVENGAYVYFVHGYASPQGEETVAVTTHGAPFSAAVEKGHLFGCQFHPERSGAVGARILENFLAIS